MVDVRSASRSRSSRSSSKETKRKKRIEDLVASCSEDIAKLQQGAAIELAASSHATQLLIERASQSTSSSAVGARQLAISEQAYHAQSAKEEWIPQGATDVDTTDQELTTSPITTDLLRVLCQDNTVLESNIRDYDIALNCVIEEVMRLRQEAHQLESTFAQMSELRDLLKREMRFTSQLHEENSRLHRRPVALLTAMREASLTKEDKHDSLISDLISENNALRRLSGSAAPFEIADYGCQGIDARQSSRGPIFANDGTLATSPSYSADVSVEEIRLPGGRA